MPSIRVGDSLSIILEPTVSPKQLTPPPERRTHVLNPLAVMRELDGLKKLVDILLDGIGVGNVRITWLLVVVGFAARGSGCVRG